MPGSTKWRGETLVQAVGVNKVPQHILDERVRNVLNLINRCAISKIPQDAEEKTADTPGTAALLRRIGADSIVLMKNDDNILPLSKEKKVSTSEMFHKYSLIFGDPHHRPQRENRSLSRRRFSSTPSLLRSNTV